MAIKRLLDLSLVWLQFGATTPWCCGAQPTRPNTQEPVSHIQFFPDVTFDLANLRQGKFEPIKMNLDSFSHFARSTAVDPEVDIEGHGISPDSCLNPSCRIVILQGKLRQRWV